MKKKLYNFLTANIQTDDFQILRRVIVSYAFLSFAVPVFLLFAFLNYFVFHQYAIAYIDIISGIISIIVLINLFKTGNISRASFIGNLNLYLFFIPFIYINQNNTDALVWLLFLPIFLISMNGHKAGLIYTVVFFSIFYPVAYFNIGVWQNGEWDLLAFTRVVLLTVIMTYMVYINELSIYRSNKLLKQKTEQEKNYRENLERLSSIDPLTEIYNRRSINNIIENEKNRFNRYDHPFSIAMLDIDHFKQINDQYGHNAGDQILLEFTQQLKKNLRSSDEIGRWGGEEFIIVFTNTPLKKAIEKCEKLRWIIEQNHFTIANKITCSIGVAEYQEDQSIQQLIQNADNAMYRAKAAGRNQVCY